MSGFDGATLGAFLALAMETKARMLEAPGEKGNFDCPKCGATVEVRLVGRNDHARAVCATQGCWSLLE